MTDTSQTRLRVLRGSIGYVLELYGSGYGSGSGYGYGYGSEGPGNGLVQLPNT